MKVFLTAKHWQLFLLFFAIPMAIHAWFMSTFFVAIMPMTSPDSMTTPPDPQTIFASFSYLMYDFAVVFVLAGGTIFGWLYSVGTKLQPMLPEGAKMSVGLFRVFLFFPLVYLISIAIGMAWLFSTLSSGTIEPPGPAALGLVFIIIPIHFFCIFCILYSFWFVSKSLKMVETQKTDFSFSEYAGEFFLIWFFFVGVWILQPRINKLFAENTE